MAIKNILLYVAVSVALCSAILFVSAPRSEERKLFNDYKAWKEQYNKASLTQDEEVHRFTVYKNNIEIINRVNAESEASGDSTAIRLSANQFADLTLQEFKKMYMGKKNSYNVSQEQAITLDATANPDQIDWRDKGAVTPVKNQGQCGSCWAFSAVAGLEGVFQLTSGKLVSMSEQQIVDCSKNGGNEGCNGGDLPPAYDYVVKNGIEAEADYKYTARDGKCKFDASKVVFKPKSYVTIKEGDGVSIEAAAAVHPVPVCIEADSSAFQFYTSGVLDSKSCGTDLDHCVLIAGYNKSSSAPKPYWIVKNSWGSSWGSKGYILILKEDSGKGICGINEEAVYPVA